MVEYWTVAESDLDEMTPVKARDLVIDCFFHAQKETFHAIKEKLNKESSDEEILESVRSIIKMTFDETGGDFENPTKQQLMAVIMNIAEKSKAWGTPEDIINHHKEQIEKIISLLD